ncbi:MAG: methionine synthase [Anaerolineaceae bacterium]|nr:methionine synthase [Anaerolineaceae bacterium]
MNNKSNTYLSHLQEHVIIFDGAMGTNLQKLNLTAEQFGGDKFAGCNDYLNITYPEAPLSIHRSFLEVGVDVIETNSFRANRITLEEFGLAHKTEEINLKGASIARQIADQYSTKDHPRFVAGSMGPSGKLISLQIKNDSSRQISFDEIRDVYQQQAQALINGGVDLLLIETGQDILEIKAAILGIHDAFKKTNRLLPIQAQVTLDTNGHMLIGTDIGAVLAILEGMPIDILGINCSTGPKHMEGSIEFLSQHSRLPISCLPNAGLPINRDGKAFYPLSPIDFANAMTSFVNKYHISTVGGCCGTTPDHLRLMVEKIGRKARFKRKINTVPSLSSAFHAVRLKQEPAPFIIGERLNTQGSRAFKRLMLNNDFKSALQIGKQQLADGAHALDICTALTENSDEAQRTTELVKLVSSQIDLPLVIDSTDVQVMESALKAIPGRCLLNSLNLENGTEKAKEIFTLAKQFNAAVIALTIDEKGMATTAKRKLEIAKRIYKLAVREYGLAPQSLVFDPLTFTLASGSIDTLDAGVHTLKAIKQIKQTFPDVFTVLGVSNISYGLKTEARKVLNSVFLTHAIKAGLDLAILNPAQITPYTTIPDEEKKLAEDLIFNRCTNALVQFIGHFQSAKNKSSNDAAENEEALSKEERIHQHILYQTREGLEADIDAYILSGDNPNHHKKAMEVLNRILLPAMKEIGQQFASGELILPFVLQSAEIMRAASDHLEKYMEKSSSNTKGKLLLATVYGDVHDIGKNLVKTIISNNGYTVVDLGKQVPAETIVDKAQALRVDAIGLSALLVSTSQHMRRIVNMLDNAGEKIPVLIGGAAVNHAFANQIKTTEKGSEYPGGVQYCKDAFDALHILNGFNQSEKEKQPTIQKKEKQGEQKKAVKKASPAIVSKLKSTFIPTPPFFGVQKVSIPLETLFSSINRNALFRNTWGAKNAKGEKWEKYQRDFEKRFKKIQEEQKTNNWLLPKAVYGYWQCNADGDTLLVYPNERDLWGEPIRFEFPRQKGGRFLCLSDYFAPLDSGVKDIVAFQLVTMGQKAVSHVHTLNNDGALAESFYAHGAAVQLTEAAARYIHDRIRRELSIGAKQGKRYSWGYPPIPDLSQHAYIVRLLRAKEYLHIELTSAFQFVPEYSTAAMVIHHPDSVYFQIK